MSSIRLKERVLCRLLLPAEFQFRLCSLKLFGHRGRSCPVQFYFLSCIVFSISPLVVSVAKVSRFQFYAIKVHQRIVHFTETFMNYGLTFYSYILIEHFISWIVPLVASWDVQFHLLNKRKEIIHRIVINLIK